jgi:type I restriction enzyme M protein
MRSGSAAQLKALTVGFHPKALIKELAEGLLAHYADKPLVDAYDVYQHLMDYWSETMQDDCYLVSADGWKAETRRMLVKNAKGKEVDRGWVCELVPKALVVARYFAKEQAGIDALQVQLDGLGAELAVLEEEHGGDDGLFAELDKVNRANVTVRLREIKADKDAKEERAALTAWLELSEKEAGIKAALKEAEAALDTAAYAKYPTLSQDEVKVLVVDDKWLNVVGAAVHGEMDRISQGLTHRVKVLAERYATPLPALVDEVDVLAARVDEHLKKMGIVWK